MLKKSLLFLLSFFLLDFGIASFLEKGLNLYFGLETDSELALIGHSHLMLGVNKDQLEKALGKKVSKYTREGVNVADRDLMIDQLLEKNPNIKTVLYGVDAWMFTGEGLSSNSYKLFYPFMDDEKVGEYIREEADFADYIQHRWIRTSRYNEGLINSSLRGYLSNWDNYKFGVVDTVQLKKNIEAGEIRRINSTDENKAIFLRSIKKLTDRGIKVVLVYVPTISYYNQAEPEKFEEMRGFFRESAQSSPLIYYLEYLEGWDNRHELFFDPIHLNPEGQEALTDVIVRDLKNLEIIQP